jgi:hypothetical protein
MAATIREGDALPVLRFRQSLMPSDCNAVFSDGRKVPVFIRKVDGADELWLDLDDRFLDPRKMAGFKTFELKPEEISAAPPAPPEPTENEIFQARLKVACKANPGTADWILRKRITAEMFQEGLARQQRARQGQQSSFGTLPDKWAGFANAAKRARNSK